jgi:hypothetical protein
MAIDLQRCARMYQANRTSSPASVWSTCEEGPASNSMHSMMACIPDGNLIVDTYSHLLNPVMELHSPDSASLQYGIRRFGTDSTIDVDVLAHNGNTDVESSLDPNDIPPTREPSPEPLWQNSGQFVWNGQNLTERIHASGRHIPTKPVATSLCSNSSTCGWNEEQGSARKDRLDGRQLPRTSSREPPVQRGYANAPAKQFYQMVYVVPNQVVVPNQDATLMWQMNNGGAMPFPIQTWPTMREAHDPSDVRMLPKEESLTQPRELPASVLQRSQISEQSTQTPVEQMKKGAKDKSSLYGKEISKVAAMSESQKEAICQYIYQFMVQKGFTSPEGHLVFDVFAELWKDCIFKDLRSSADTWRVANFRFSELLCSAPHLFEHFRKRFRVDKRCAWLDRKGVKMFRLVPKN